MTTLSKQQLADIKIHKDAYRHHHELMRGARRHRRYLPYKQKKETRRSQFLRSNPVDISREHRAFLDVGDAEEASGDALETDGEAAVRGHAVSLPSLPRAAGAHTPHPAWHIRAR